MKISQPWAFVILLGVVLPTGAHAQLAAAVLPASRSVAVGGTATAFATVINAGTTVANNCAIALATNIPATIAYQTTNPSTNAVTGQPNTPVNIAGAAAQTFVIGITTTAAFGATDVSFTFACTGTDPAPLLSGINTLLLSAAAGTPDIVALGATVSKDGILHLPSATGSAAFAVATINLGSSDPITVSADTGSATLPLVLTICQTNPMSGACLAPSASTVTTKISANATPTFAFFATATDDVAPLFAANRVFARFSDPTGVVRGATSVAVQTAGFNPAPPPNLNFVACPAAGGACPPPGVAGQAYLPFCFCSPTPSQPNGLCGSLSQSNPNGGNPPYHFQLDSGIGFPPIGISLSLNGCLTGTPAAPGTSPFGVCAVDLNGAQVCQTVTMTVTGQQSTETWSGTLTGTLTPNCGDGSGKFAENAALTFLVPAPGLVASFNAPGSASFGGTFSDNETVLTQTDVGNVNGCTLVGSATGNLSTTVNLVNDNTGNHTCVMSQSGLLPVNVTSQGRNVSMPFRSVLLEIAPKNATTVSGSWLVGAPAGCGNGLSFGIGTVTLGKQ